MVALINAANRDNNHFFVWICEAWLHLHDVGVTAQDIGGDPRLLVTGFFERKAQQSESRRPFKIQRYLTRAVESLLGAKLITDSTPPAERARIISKSDNAAAAWSHTRPTKVSLRMSPHEVKVSAAVLNGTAFDGSTLCICGLPLTTAHATSCRKLSARIMRHDWLVQECLDILLLLGLWARKEVQVVPGTDARIDLLFRIDGVYYWCDVMVTQPCCQSYLDMGSAVTPGAALKAGEAKKFHEWNNRHPPAGVVILPLVLEASGRMGSHFKKFLKLIVKHATDNRASSAFGSQPFSFVSNLVRQLSVTLHRGNVAMVDQAEQLSLGSSTTWRAQRPRYVTGPGWH